MHKSQGYHCTLVSIPSENSLDKSKWQMLKMLFKKYKIKHSISGKGIYKNRKHVREGTASSTEGICNVIRGYDEIGGGNVGKMWRIITRQPVQITLFIIQTSSTWRRRPLPGSPRPRAKPYPVPLAPPPRIAKVNFAEAPWRQLAPNYFIDAAPCPNWTFNLLTVKNGEN